MQGQESQPPLCVFHQRGRCRSGTNCPFVHLGDNDLSSGPKCQPKSHKMKDSNKIAQVKKKTGENSLQIPTKEKIHAEGNLMRHEATGPHGTPLVNSRREGRLLSRDAFPVVTSYKTTTASQESNSRHLKLNSKSIQKIKYDSKNGKLRKETYKIKRCFRERAQNKNIQKLVSRSKNRTQLSPNRS